jgi:hypothetical protein
VGGHDRWEEVPVSSSRRRDGREISMRGREKFGHGISVMSVRETTCFDANVRYDAVTETNTVHP